MTLRLPNNEGLCRSQIETYKRSRGNDFPTEEAKERGGHLGQPNHQLRNWMYLYIKRCFVQSFWFILSRKHSFWLLGGGNRCYVRAMAVPRFLCSAVGPCRFTSRATQAVMCMTHKVLLELNILTKCCIGSLHTEHGTQMLHHATKNITTTQCHTGASKLKQNTE